jgi:CHASE2 domain-containing sensor protein
MKLNTVFLFTAILTLFGAVVIILFPEVLMSFFTGRPMVDKAPVLYIQWFGALHLCLSVLSWRARKLNTEARRTVLITMLVYCIGGVLITGRFQFTGLLNGWGWFFPAHQAALGLIYAYYLFVRKDLIGTK